MSHQQPAYVFANIHIPDKFIKYFFLTQVFSFIMKIFLDYLYVVFVSEYYGYLGHVLNISYGKIVESYLLIFLFTGLIAIITYKNTSPGMFVILLLYVFLIIPLLTLYGFQNAPTLFIHAVMISFLIIIAVFQWTPKISFPTLSGREGLFFAFLGISLVLVYVYGSLLLTGGLTRLSLSFSAVYEVRSSLIEILDTKAPFLSYLLPWQAHVINMGILSYAIYKNKKGLGLIILLAQLLIFMMSGYKSFLFAPFLVFSVWYLSKKRDLFLKILLGMSFLLMASYILFITSNNTMIPSVSVRRLFFTPAQLHCQYYDWFSRNKHVMLSNSIFKPIVSYPYDRPVTQIISDEYYDGQSSPNVGFFGDAYFHFGYLGMMIFSILLALLLKSLDSICLKIPNQIANAVIVLPAFAFINSGLFTVLLTHGLLAAMVLLWTIRGWLHQREAVGPARKAGLFRRFLRNLS
jgi:oligosaccharide repeat unit polymerase